LAEISTTTSAQHESDALAIEAVSEVQSDMTVGLGTGRSAARAIMALGARVRHEGLQIECVCTSKNTEVLATEQGLSVVQFGQLEAVDILIDGADEVDDKFRMLKGQHGAVARQRLVARAAAKRIYLASDHKLVSRLGEQATLPICVLEFGLSFVREELRNLGLSGVVRRTMSNEKYITDDGNLVIDVSMPDRDPETVAAEIDSVPGVVDHGLFLSEADELLIENKQGAVRRLIRG
jgi:ribose 5-phosphate isomerase A